MATFAFLGSLRVPENLFVKNNKLTPDNTNVMTMVLGEIKQLEKVEMQGMKLGKYMKYFAIVYCCGKIVILYS